MKPLVTVLITTYNSEHWVKIAISSVIEQTYDNLQILIIDDGSTDNTVKAINSFDDERIDLHLKVHSGIAGSTNFALDKIKGEFVARMDSDDYMVKYRIDKQLRFITNNRNYGIIGTNFILVDEKNKQLQKIQYPENHNSIINILPRKCCIAHSSVFMKTDILFELNGYDENRTIGEDWDFFLRCIGKTKFYNIQEHLTYVRLHRSNISLISSAGSETEDILLNYNLRIIQNSNNKIEIAKAHFNIGYHYYYSDRFDDASEKFKDALDLNKTNLSFWRYYLATKYFSSVIKFMRKKKLFRFYNWLRHLDKGSVFIRGRF